MAATAEDRLKSLGVDVEFVAWLEGEGEWLPRIDRIDEITSVQFVEAFRAVEWLAQWFASPGLIAPTTPEEWSRRYECVEMFLYSALKYSMVAAHDTHHEDLATLEAVLAKLFPVELWTDVKADIQKLRLAKQPVRLPIPSKQHRSGGPKQSEQTERMRAAIEVISQVVNRERFALLAAFWNERLGLEKYHGEDIRSRLRKGLQTGSQAREFWKVIYDGELRAVFPGPFPLHPKLRSRVMQYPYP